MSLRFVGSSLALTLRASPNVLRCRKNCARFSTKQWAEGIGKYRSGATGVYFYSSDNPLKCWQCNYPFKSEFFCQKCKALQEPPEQLNYFQIIGVDESYDVDNKDLQRKYRDLQNQLHPDRFSNKTEKEKQISEIMSSLVNKAYNTLSHPLDRGLYMLKLKNMYIQEGAATSFDPEFLMEIMERNEKVEEASNNKEKIVELMDENNKILEELSGEVSKAFKASDLERGKLILTKMKYYASLQTRLKNLKSELGIVD